MGVLGHFASWDVFRLKKSDKKIFTSHENF